LIGHIDDLCLALTLADIADSVAMERFRTSIAWECKRDGTPVCDVDRDIEQALARQIMEARPGDQILSEEELNTTYAHTFTDQQLRRWIIDPIDQTRHYVRGNPEFATLIALQIAGQTDIGVVSAPALGHRWWAVLGGGAWKDDQPIAVSKATSLEEAYLTIAGHREWYSQWEWDVLVRLLDRCSYPAGCAGGFLQQMLVAEGMIDVFIEPWGDIWDHVGPSLIVEEAGGMSTTLEGTPPTGGSILATNRKLHQDTLAYLKPKK
jgi:histidinol-phosphatase